jgi:hypothetical protein
MGLGEAIVTQNSGQRDLTFLDCVLCKFPKRRIIKGKYADKSLLLFREDSYARSAAIQIIESK